MESGKCDHITTDVIAGELDQDRVYQDAAAVFAIDSVECLGGGLPRTQQRLVEAWAEIHRSELEHDWDLLQSGRPPVKIEPLR